jgi:hypothetical protein
MIRHGTDKRITLMLLVILLEPGSEFTPKTDMNIGTTQTRVKASTQDA